MKEILSSSADEFCNGKRVVSSAGLPGTNFFFIENAADKKAQSYPDGCIEINQGRALKAFLHGVANYVIQTKLPAEKPVEKK